MATGDQSDMVARLRAALPTGWFPDSAPNLLAVLNGFAYGLARIYSTLAFARLQSRIATATGIWLDGIAFDFFGTTLARSAGQADMSLRSEITTTLLLPKGTRAGVTDVLVQLTGRAPLIFEPRDATDAGGYGFQGMTVGTGLEYENISGSIHGAGGYGSLALPFQFFGIAYRSTVGGVPNLAGYYYGSGWAGGGYRVGAIDYLGTADTAGQVTDADIYAAVASVLPVGTTAWVAISN